jgi:hypothetical protein
MLIKIKDFLEEYDDSLEAQVNEFLGKYRELMETAWENMLRKLVSERGRAYVYSCDNISVAQIDPRTSQEDVVKNIFHLIMKFPFLKPEDYDNKLKDLVEGSYERLLQEINSDLIPKVSITTDTVGEPVVKVNFCYAY